MAGTTLQASQPSRATPLGTSRFAHRFSQADATHFRRVRGLTIGSIGIGTYRGEPSAAFDRRARAAILCAVANGCNLIDTASSYRAGRSEIVVGEAIRALEEAGIARRSELVVCSKAGYLCNDKAPPRALSSESVDGNVLSPAFLSREIARSLGRTGLDAIDLYLLHNPELHLSRLGPRRFYRLLARCFEVLERHIEQRKVASYGLACWSAFDRRATGAALDIVNVLRAARLVGGDDTHHFGVIETPLNWVHRNPIAARPNTPLLEVCRENNLILLGSSPLLGGRLVRLPGALRRAIPGGLTHPQCSVQFARSLPGTAAAIVGMNRRDHILQNLGLRNIPTMGGSLVRALCDALEAL
jgi:aryl-alcohol dehydrogenase-like predicted oxidoreductase